MERVYVGNLPPDIRIKDIDDFFRPFGKLIYIDVNHRANPVYAYVQFDSARNAFNAVKSRHGYDYEGYTLQMRLVENEVRKRRDDFSDYGLQSSRGGSNNDFNTNSRMGGNSYSSMSSFQSSSNSQCSNNNRSSMTPYSNSNRSNMMDYPSNNRSIMQQQNVPYSSSGRSNNQNRSNIPQQYNSNRSNIEQQQYNNPNRSNMSEDNTMNYSRRNNSNVSQQSMMNFANNIPQDINTMDYSNNSSCWQSGNNTFWSSSWDGNTNMNNKEWNSGNNVGDNYNNAAPYVYNANNDPYAKPSYEDSYTRGLSGSGRKWFSRYIRKGFSPEMARSKALEHRTVPYFKDDPSAQIQNPDLNDPTNAALETIGNTIISLLSTNGVDNFSNNNEMMNWTGNNSQARYDMPGPSNARGDGKRNRSPARNRVSKRQYLKSLDFLKKLRSMRRLNAEDRLSKKYHTQIVKDYEQFEKTSDKSRVSSSLSANPRNERQIISKAAQGKSNTELSVAFRKKKQQLLLAGRRVRDADGYKSNGGAYKKRWRMLKNEYGFPWIEAKYLAIHDTKKLEPLLALKADCDRNLNKKPIKKNDSYRSDINFLKLYEKRKFEDLSYRIKTALRRCLTRIHKHEKEVKMPLTKTKFTQLLSTNTGKNTANSKKTPQNKTTEKKTNEIKATKKEIVKKEEKGNKNTKEIKANAASDKRQEIQGDNVEGTEDIADDEEANDDAENAENVEHSNENDEHDDENYADEEQNDEIDNEQEHNEEEEQNEEE